MSRGDDQWMQRVWSSTTSPYTRTAEEEGRAGGGKRGAASVQPLSATAALAWPPLIMLT